MYDTKMNKVTKRDALALEAFNLATKDCSNVIILSLLTPKEKIMLGRRLLLAQGIIAGKTRFELNNLIRVSPNTFAQINRWLESELGTYTPAQEAKKTDKRSTSRYVRPFSYEHLKKKYPMHFLLFSMIEKLIEK